MKKIINCLIIVIVLILFIPTAKATEVKTTYTNYYFFLEPYKQSDIDGAAKKETTNYTAFPPLENGEKNFVSATPIILAKSCEDINGEECWTYSYFYDIYKEIEKTTPVIYKINSVEHKSQVKVDGNTKYYLHGRYYDDGIWKEPDTLNTEGIEDPNFITKFSCASIYPSNINLVPVDYELHRNPNINNLDSFYIEIDRTFNEGSFNNINWDFTYEKEKNYSTCPLIEENQIPAFAYNNSSAKIYSPVVYKYEYTVTENKCDVEETKKEMSCNDWTNLSSTCNKLTVKNGNSIADVKIVQNGYISNIFESNLVNTDINYDASSYDGGWLKYGIIYYNEVSWELLNLSQGDENEIKKAMQDRLKDNFEENLTLTINGLDGSRLIKKCTESGAFTDGSKLVTTCTFFLPESFIKDNNGKVYYSESNDNTSINNKYYIPFNEKEHSVSVTLTGLSRLSENKAVEDSAEKDKAWIGDWTISTKCNLKVINRLQPSKYKFTYRPIDLSNPFPNRSPGVNWYSWYIIENNKGKKTLEDSYKNLEYYTQLDNKTISEIKKYNKENTYFGEVDENFFKTYIKEGGNS